MNIEDPKTTAECPHLPDGAVPFAVTCCHVLLAAMFCKKGNCPFLGGGGEEDRTKVEGMEGVVKGFSFLR